VFARLLHLLNEEGAENALEKGTFALEKGALACVCVYLRLGRVLSLSHQHVLARLFHLFNKEGACALEKKVFALEMCLR